MFRSPLHRRAAVSLVALASGLCAAHLAAQSPVSSVGPSELPAPAASGSPVPLQYSYNTPDPLVTSGSVTFTRGTPAPAHEVYTVNSPTAVLDFKVAGGGSDPALFQNPNTTVTYQNGAGVTDFTVLNRVSVVDPATGAAAAQAIRFEGTVLSQLRAASGTTAPGGTVWFYSPGGIVVGSTATFDVGSLLLTTADPTGGTGVIGDVNKLTLVTAPSRGTPPGIVVESGASLTASPNNSYIALVAPAIAHYGTTTVNGGAAFVAAESATLTINQGLFDIQVAIGSDGVDRGSPSDGEGGEGGGSMFVPLELNGTVKGQGPSAAGQNRAIYAVAVPKNEAITMLVAPDGQLGFTAATGATIENGAIYLQAGDGVSITSGAPITSRMNLPTRGTADISLTLGSITSPLVAQASNALDAVAYPVFRSAATAPGGGGSAPLPNPSLDGGGYFYGGNSASVRVVDVTAANSFGPITIQSFGAAGAGLAQLYLSNSTLDVAGAIGIHADPTGRTLPTGWTAATGGDARLLNFASMLSARAIAISANGGSANENATGGRAQLYTDSDINVAGGVTIDANATVTGASGIAQGGRALLTSEGGTLTAGQLDQRAVGLSAFGAYGGNASIEPGEGSGALNVAGAVTLDARARSGDLTAIAAPAGLLSGGQASLSLGGGLTNQVGALVLDASAEGDGRSTAVNPNTAGAYGGAASVFVDSGTVLNAGDVTLRATAQGMGAATGAGGGANGGTASVEVEGTLTLDRGLSLAADATGGASANDVGGSGLGGNATVQGDGALVAGALTASSVGRGGVGLTGGDGSGGTVLADAGAGSLTVNGPVMLDASGIGAGAGGSGAGGNGVGGFATLDWNTGTLSVGNLTIAADGHGGASVNGQAGQGQGGSAFVGKGMSGSAQFVGGLVSASGRGGATTGGTGGDGRGGSAGLRIGTGQLSTSVAGQQLGFVANGVGGDAAVAMSGPQGTAGGGFGGTASIDADTGTARLDTLVLLAATGQGGSAAMGSAGAAKGGTASLTNNDAADLTFRALTLNAGAVAGTGRTGAAATGGQATIDVGTGRLSTGALSAAASATGMTADAGLVSVTSDSGAVTVTGQTTLAALATAGGAPGVVGTVSVRAGTTDAAGIVDLGRADLKASQLIAIGAVDGQPSTGDIRFDSLAATAGGRIEIAQDLALRNGDAMLSSGGVLLTRNLAGPGLIAVSAAKSGMLGTLSGRDVTVTGGAGMTTGDITASNSVTGNAGTLALGNVSAGGPVRLTSLGDLTAGALRGGSIYALAGGALKVGAPSIVTGGVGDASITLISGQTLTVGDIMTTGSIALAARGGDLGAGAINGGGDVLLFARDAVTAAGVRAGGVAKIGGAAEPGAGTVPLTLAATPATRVGGAVQVAGGIRGARVDVAATNGITTPTVTATGAAQLDSGNGIGVTTITAGSATVGGTGTVAIDSTTTTGALSVATAGDIALGAFTSGGPVSLAATGGRLGVARASRADGAVDLSGGTITTAALTGGARVSATASAGALTTGDIAAAGGIGLAARSGTVTAGALKAGGDLVLLAATDVSAASLSAGGVAKIGGAAELGAATAPLTLAATPATRVGGAVQVAGSIRGAQVDVAATNGITTPTVTATGAVRLDSGNGVGVTTITAGSAAVGGTGTVAIDSITTTGVLSLATTGDIALGAFTSGGPASLAATGGRLGVARASRGDGAIDLNAGTITTAALTGGARVSATAAAGALTTGDITAAGGIGLAARSGTVTAGTLKAGGDLVLLAATDVSVTSLSAGGGVQIGGVASLNPGADPLGLAGATLPRSGGAVRIAGTTDARAVTIGATGPITLGGGVTAPVVRVATDAALSTQAITAAQSIALTGGTVTLNGAVVAPTIALAGRDLTIGTNGAVGGTGTTDVTITLLAGVTTVALGDATGATGFAIDQAEFGRISAGALTIGDGSTGAPRVVIGTLALAAGSGAGRIGALRVATAGDLDVIGALRLTGADASNSVALAAGGAVTVRTDTGSIALTGASGAEAGSLSLRGRDILVGASDFVAAAPGQTAADLARAAATLATVPAPGGTVRAGGIDLGASRLIAVQNSGTMQTAAGLLAGSGGLTLTSTAQAGTLPLVIIYGAVANGAGFAVNRDTRRFVRLTRSGQAATASAFDAASTVNGCSLVLTTPCLIGAGALTDDPALVAIAPNVRAEVGGLIGLESSALGTRLTVGVPSLIDTSGIDAAGIVTDPVGSAGNPALWEPTSTDEEDRRRRARAGAPR